MGDAKQDLHLIPCSWEDIYYNIYQYITMINQIIFFGAGTSF